MNDTRKDLVEKITLKKLELTLTNPSNTDFSFLESINIFISAEGIPETKIAWKDNIPSDISNFLILDVSEINLKEYIIKDNFVLKLNVVTDELLASDHEIDIHSVFFVDAKLLGQ